MSFKSMILLSSLILVGSIGASGEDFSVVVTDSYLDDVGNLTNSATVVDLSASMFLPGNQVMLEAIGEYSLAGPETEPSAPLSSEMIGVFSSSSTLLPLNSAAPQNRVVDAIDAGADVVTDNDIPQDFFIAQTVLDIPIGATHLFVAPLDGFVGDNADDNGDFALRITQVPEPSAFWMLLLGLLVFLRP